MQGIRLKIFESPDKFKQAQNQAHPSFEVVFDTLVIEKDTLNFQNIIKKCYQLKDIKIFHTYFAKK